MNSRKCRACGVSLSGEHHNRRVCRDCKPDDRKHHDAAGYRRRRDSKPRPQRFCRDCPEEITHMHGLVVRCGDCQTEARRGQCRERDRAMRASDPNYREKRAARLRTPEYREHARRRREEPDVRQALRDAWKRYRRRHPNRSGERKWDETVTEAAVASMLAGQDGCCAWCGVDVSDGTYHKDHIKPLARGGASTLSNMQLLCRACNSSKRDRVEPLRARRATARAS